MNISLKTLLLLVLSVLLFSYLIVSNIKETRHQQYVIQAESLLQGKLELNRLDRFGGEIDTVLVDGKYYWPLGVFPAIVLAPFSALANTIGAGELTIGPINLMVNLLSLLLAFRIAKKNGFTSLDSYFLSIALLFGSVAVLPTFIPHSWYFAQSVAFFFTLLAIDQFFSHRPRYLLVGLSFGAIILTRVTAALPVFFFIAHLFIFKRSNRLNAATKIILPLALATLIMLWLNQIRFGNPLDTGYAAALIAPEIQRTMREGYGLFAIENFFSNFYLYFLKPFDTVFEAGTYHLKPPFFQVNPIGLSFFIVSPIFARVLVKLKDVIKLRQNQIILVATIPVVLILLTYYASGFWTLGPRYLLDVLPFWYLLLMSTYKEKRLRTFDYVLILLSIGLNLIMLRGLLYNPSMMYWYS